MEIQTFLFAGSVRYSPEHHNYNATQIGTYSFAPEDAKFPFRNTLRYFLTLRRVSCANLDPIKVSLRLVRNGLLIYQGHIVSGEHFGEGQRFWSQAGTCTIEFPAAGDYRLELRAGDEDASPYIYEVEVTSEGIGWGDDKI